MKIRAFILSIFILSISLMGCSLDDNYSVRRSSGSSSSSWTDEKNTECEFEKGQKITFSYDSKVNNGELSIQLLNPQNEVVLEFEINKEGKIEKEITESGTYILLIKGNEFNGSYSVDW